MRKKSGEERQLISSKFGLPSSQPLVCFALCTGAFSDPVVTSFFYYTSFYTVMQLECHWLMVIGSCIFTISWFGYKLPMFFRLNYFHTCAIPAEYGIKLICSQFVVVELLVKLHSVKLQWTLIGIWMSCWNLKDFFMLYYFFYCMV